MLNLSFVKALLDVNSFHPTSRKLVSFYDVNVISFAHFLGSIISCCLVNKRALVPQNTARLVYFLSSISTNQLVAYRNRVSSMNFFLEQISVADMKVSYFRTV